MKSYKFFTGLSKQSILVLFVQNNCSKENFPEKREDAGAERKFFFANLTRRRYVPLFDFDQDKTFLLMWSKSIKNFLEKRL